MWPSPLPRPLPRCSPPRPGLPPERWPAGPASRLPPEPVSSAAHRTKWSHLDSDQSMKKKKVQTHNRKQLERTSCLNRLGPDQTKRLDGQTDLKPRQDDVTHSLCMKQLIDELVNVHQLKLWRRNTHTHTHTKNESGSVPGPKLNRFQVRGWTQHHSSKTSKDSAAINNL